MAQQRGFKEESFFTGAEKGQGFSPSQAPDISPFLRDRMAEFSQQVGKLKSQKAVENEAKLLQRVRDYEAFGTIAPKFLEAAQLLGQSHLSNLRVEANAATRNISKDPRQARYTQAQYDALQAYDQGIQEIEQNTIDLAPQLAKAAKTDRLPPDAIREVKQYTGIYEVAAKRNHVGNRIFNYEQSLLMFKTNKDVRLPKPAELGGGFFTPSEAGDNPVLHRIVNEAHAKLYDVDTGVEYLSDGLLRPYNDHINKIHDKTIAAVEELQRGNQGDADRKNFVQDFLNHRNLNLLIANISGTYDKTKGSMGMGDATDYVYSTALPGLKYAGLLDTEELKQLFKQEVSAEFAPPGTTHEKWHAERINGPEGILRKLNEKDNYDANQRLKKRERLVEADRTDFWNEVAKLDEQGIVMTQDQLDQRLKNVMKATGINDPTAFPHYKDYTTRESLDIDEAKKQLDYIRSVNGRGYLVASDLYGKPQEVVTAYTSAVREDAEYAKFAASYNDRSKARVTSLTNEVWKDQIGKDEKSTAWNKSYDAMYSDYLVKRQELLNTLGIDKHADAHEGALKYVEDQSKKGVYTKPAGASDNSARVQELVGLRREAKKGTDIFSSPALWSDEVKQNLKDFAEGKTNSLHPHFATLSMNTYGQTAWENANKLHRAIHGTDMRKTVKQDAIENQGAAVQRVIRGPGATLNRILRGQTIDNPQGSFNPQPVSFKPIAKENFTRETPSSGSYQPGFDMWDPDKTPRSPFFGIIKEVFTTQDKGYGLYGNGAIAEVNHPELGKVDMLISHLATKTPLKEGQRIAPGQILGTQGGTGRVVSIDGTISSYDFFKVAPRGSKSMEPPENLDLWINYAMQFLQGGR